MFLYYCCACKAVCSPKSWDQFYSLKDESYTAREVINDEDLFDKICKICGTPIELVGGPTITIKYGVCLTCCNGASSVEEIIRSALLIETLRADTIRQSDVDIYFNV